VAAGSFQFGLSTAEFMPDSYTISASVPGTIANASAPFVILP
jgi:hypothetical protein